MSPIAIGMDLLLAGLLAVALLVGLRLSAQLKALRNGQLAFAKAVMDLDTAAGRAESGLKAIRAAADETHDSLLARIETARVLTAKLEAATFEAEKAAAAPAPAPAAAPLPPRLAAINALLSDAPKVVELPAAAPRPARAAAPAAPAVKLRPRGLHDDLFEAPEAARNTQRSAR